MEKFNVIDYNYSNLGEKHLVFFEVDKKPSEKLSESLVSKDKPFVIEIYAEKKKRSLTANSYLFALLNQIANKLNRSLGDVYCKAIVDYGIFASAICKKEAFEMVERLHNASATKVEHSSALCCITKEWKKGDVEWVEFNAFYGSSSYDKSEFSKLLNGVVGDAKEMGIETLDDIRLKELVERMNDEVSVF